MHQGNDDPPPGDVPPMPILKALVDIDRVGLRRLVEGLMRQDLSHHAASLPQGHVGTPGRAPGKERRR